MSGVGYSFEDLSVVNPSVIDGAIAQVILRIHPSTPLGEYEIRSNGSFLADADLSPIDTIQELSGKVTVTE